MYVGYKWYWTHQWHASVACISGISWMRKMQRLGPRHIFSTSSRGDMKYLSGMGITTRFETAVK